MTRAGPFRQELVFAGDIRQTHLDLLIYRRIDKVKKREERAESVPESCVRIEISVAYLSVVRAVVNRLSRSIDLIELAREQKASVET